MTANTKPGITPQLMPFLARDTVSMSTAKPYYLFDTQKMKNPFRSPMIIDEIRFECPAFEANPFLYLQARIRFGQDYLTDGFVPIALLGGVFNRYPTSPYNDGGGNAIFPQTQIWRFAKPLYAAPDDIVSIEIQIDPTLWSLLPTGFPGVAGSAFSATVTAAMACRSMPLGTPPPNQVCLPWLAKWRTPNLTLGEKTVVRSTKLNLVNNFDQDLKIQSFIGRLFSQYDDAVEGAYQVSPGTPCLQPATTSNPSLYENDVTLTMKHITGAQIIKDPVPFGQVFSTTDNCWYPNAVLRPQAYYIATLAADLRLYNSEGLPASFSSPVFGLIALNGHRTVPLRSQS